MQHSMSFPTFLVGFICLVTIIGMVTLKKNTKKKWKSQNPYNLNQSPFMEVVPLSGHVCNTSGQLLLHTVASQQSYLLNGGSQIF